MFSLRQLAGGVVRPFLCPLLVFPGCAHVLIVLVNAPHREVRMPMAREFVEGERVHDERRDLPRRDRLRGAIAPSRMFSHFRRWHSSDRNPQLSRIVETSCRRNRPAATVVHAGLRATAAE
jgi:hypothetical protein